MEILIRLAGIQLGPYSEEQVRQHLEEGLLSLSDSAKRDGMEDWAPLGDVLAELPAEPSSPDAAPPEPSPETAPEPESEPLLEPEVDEIPEAPKRAPATPPGVTHLPTRQQLDTVSEPESSDIGATSKKTILIGPTAPVGPAATGQSPGTIVTTSPLVTANQSTKQVSRAALIKALAQSTSPLPTKAIKAVSPRPPTIPDPASSPAPDAKKPLPPSLARDTSAKTVSMRPTPGTPAAPPVQSKLPTTSPLPTRAVFKPASGAVRPPSVPEEPPKALNPLVLPGHAEMPPPEHGLEVATVKIGPPPPPSAKPPETPPAKVPPPVPVQPVEETTTKVPPRRLMPKIIMAWAALAAFMVYYIWSPYHSAASLRYALEQGSPPDLDATIDFSSVRASLKDQISSQVAQAGLPDNGNNSLAPSPASTVLAMLDHSVDLYVTPDGISALVNKSDQFANDDQAQLIAPDVAAKILLGFNTQPVQPVNGEGLASLFDFVSDRDVAMLHLQYQGLGWKLKQIDLRPDFASRTSSGAAPILAPVVDTFLERGTAKLKNGDWKGAIADFSEVLAIDPQSGVAYNDRGAARQASGDIDGAIKDFTQALVIDPLTATAYNGRGNAKIAKNDLDGAIADYTQAVSIDPSLASAYDSRGNAKTGKDDLEGAIADFTQAITIDPNFASAYSDRGFARQANGNLDGAIADYTAALALKPKLAGAYFNRGLARQAQGNLDAAIVDFDRALAFDPTIADAYYYRGNAKSANHDVDGAIADYTKALSLNAKIAPAYGNRGLARQAKGDLDGAVSDYTQALALDPKIASAYFNRGVIEAQKNDLDNAIADSTQALYLDPKNAQAYYTRGFAKLTKGNLDGALTDLKQFCDLAPRDHNADHARLYLWLISKAQNSGADADQDLSTALETSWNSGPDDPVTKTANFLLGRINEADYLAAAASPDAATDQAQHCEAWYFTGMKRLLMADKAGAIDAFNKCVATQQKDYSEYVLAEAELQALAPPPAPPAPAPPSAKTPPAKKT